MRPKRRTKKDRSIHDVVTTQRKDGFSGYEIVHDVSFVSFLPKGKTVEEADCIKNSIKKTDSISYIWADDLKSGVLNPPSGNSGRKRARNSFLIYRCLVQRCFKGQQRDISKEATALWKGESEEMILLCYQISDIEKKRISLSMKCLINRVGSRQFRSEH